jgi:carboxymethylenebutenolidase
MSGNSTSITARDRGRFTGYLAMPKSRPAPGVLIVQEIFGVNPHIRDVVDQYAADGYVALAPDMFWRVEPNLQLDYTPEGIQKARSLRGKFNLELGMDDVAASLDALRATPGCSGNVAVIGYCFGGFIAYLTAARTGVAAASCYYGGGIDGFLGEANSIKCPIQFHYGAEDQGIPMAAVEKVRSAFAGRKDAEVFVYKGAGHGFNCDRRPSFHETASKLARERTLDLLRRTIGPR